MPKLIKLFLLIVSLKPALAGEPRLRSLLKVEQALLRQNLFPSCSPAHYELRDMVPLNLPSTPASSPEFGYLMPVCEISSAELRQRLSSFRDKENIDPVLLESKESKN